MKGIVLACAIAMLPACETMGQPNMESALDALQSARSSLERAAHNKGGHRVRALELVNAAINEVQIGIRVGDREP